jgi:biopolymer transport protein ExbD
MIKNRFSSKKRVSDEMSLQITSMADIFTIILVFLLKSYATSAINVTPSQGTVLPVAQGSETQVEALKIEISQGGIQVEQKPVTALQDFHFGKGDLLENGSSTSLNKVLEGERKRQEMISKANTDVKADAKILVIADQKTPYSTIKSVLASAAINGYTDFKLAVVRKGD